MNEQKTRPMRRTKVRAIRTAPRRSLPLDKAVEKASNYFEIAAVRQRWHKKRPGQPLPAKLEPSGWPETLYPTVLVNTPAEFAERPLDEPLQSWLDRLATAPANQISTRAYNLLRRVVRLGSTKTTGDLAITAFAGMKEAMPRGLRCLRREIGCHTVTLEEVRRVVTAMGYTHNPPPSKSPFRSKAVATAFETGAFEELTKVQRHYAREAWAKLRPDEAMPPALLLRPKGRKK